MVWFAQRFTSRLVPVVTRAHDKLGVLRQSSYFLARSALGSRPSRRL